ncbi:YqjF family protein [Gracilibacillus xinjiangensis]|uniref:YqjF family protein n=1 Tax=Gracilibacillus xinjiangensis TaxID=1193282 RepID=A0ABV8WT15_9BACI
MYKEILHTTDHRDKQLPGGPWLMSQRWDHLLFIHLPVSKEVMKKHIPDGLELDTYEGTAWITILPFKLSKMHFRKIPPIPFLNTFLELNVRTYVKRNDTKGIYFFSLDADKFPAVLGARAATLPYVYAKMDMKQKGNTFYYYCRRKRSSKAFKGSYRPISEPYYPERNSLSHWLLERYFLWSKRNDSLYSVGIHHRPWKVQDVEVEIEEESILPDFAKDTIIGKPVFHYAYSRRVLFWPIKKVD